MAEHHARIAPQSGDMALAELATTLGRNQQIHRLSHERVGTGIGEGFLPVESFVGRSQANHGSLVRR